MHRGWFPVHRKIFASDVWQHPTARIVWIYILGTVTHQEVTLSERYQAVTLQPAQMVTSQDAIAAKCRLSRKSVRSALNYLKATNRVAIKSANRFSIITVLNWPAYRDAMSGEGQQNGQQIGQQGASKGPAGGHIQEDFEKTEKGKKDLPLPLAPLGGAADRSEDPPQDTPEQEAEAKRTLQKAMREIGNPTALKDRGNGKDHGVVEEKTTENTAFIRTLTPEEKRALILVGARYNKSETSLEDALVELQVVHRFSEGKITGSEKVLKEGKQV